MQVFSYINEVKLLIYRFLTSGPKKIKKRPRPIKLGLIGSLAVEALNVWQVIVTLNRISTEP